MNADSPVTPAEQSPSFVRYTLGFLLVGIAWGGTTPFMRRAALHAPPSPTNTSPNTSFLTSSLHALVSTLKRPAYAIPLFLNLTGSVWFFLLVGQAELSLTVPVTNALAFLCTVGAEWWAEGKGVGRETWMGMGLVLAGIALCVWSKT